jgi:ADP-heptose:LPS heptosyltransferase
MEKIFYFCPPTLGDNIYTLPVIRHLNEKYNLITICNPNVYEILKHYSFVKDIRPIANFDSWTKDGPNKDAVSQVENIKKEHGIIKCVSAFDFIVFKWAKVFGIHVVELPEKKPDLKRLSSAEDWAQRFNIPIEDVPKSFIPPTPVSHDGAGKIVLNIGSNERLRKIPNSVYISLTNALTSNFPDKKIFAIFNFDDGVNGINGNVNLVHNGNIAQVINLFSSGVDCIISPDSDYYWLAKTYQIPSILLESRVKIESLTPHFLLNKNSKVYRLKEPSCAEDCRARIELKHFGGKIEPFKPRKFLNEIKGYEDFYKNPKYFPHNLACFNLKDAPCLSFSEKDVDEIIKMTHTLTQ